MKSVASTAWHSINHCQLFYNPHGQLVQPDPAGDIIAAYVYQLAEVAGQVLQLLQG